jgi:peptidoglycan/LPS O-acetylase OafA/YrhL
MSVLSFFEWLEASPIGVFMKDLPATFAVVEAVHLIALAVLGGAVLASDLRLLNVVMRDVPSNVVTEAAHRWFKIALTALLITGFFMLAGVATKCYHNPFYWVKMTALAIGVVFVFAVRRPVLKKDHSQLHPATLKLLGLASLSVWFIVAASGRWIGFS